MKQLSEKALKILGDVYTITEGTAADYICNTTGTSGKPLSLTQLTRKILEDPNNVDWVLEEGYYRPWYDLDPDPAQELFQSWKVRLLVKIETENAAIDRLNAIAEAADKGERK